jgi:predicted metal-dependent HD superfamily phosphohydrolase
MTLDSISDNRSGGLIQDAMLRGRFSALWRRNLLPGANDETDALWHLLANHYSEPHRHYHTKQHLAFCLQQLDLAGDRIRQPDQVEMAIWFHDVIHKAGERDNERRSAEWFRGRATGVIPADFIAAVVDLIMVTTHRDQVQDVEHQFICDIDLASFGAPWECFMRNSDAVRAEFPVPDEEFYRGERGFLSALLKRPRIFRTDFFHDRYEEQARENISCLIELIDQRQD